MTHSVLGLAILLFILDFSFYLIQIFSRSVETSVFAQCIMFDLIAKLMYYWFDIHI